MTTPTIDLTPASEFDGAMFEDRGHDGLWIRVAAFDNFGKTADRYTVLVEQDAPWRDPDTGEHEPELWSFFASPHPSSPQGIGMTHDGHAIDESEGNYVVGFDDLPDAVQESVWRIAATGWLLGTPTGSAMLVYDYTAQRWIIERFLHQPQERTHR